MPDDFDRFPVWMNGHWFDEDDVERKYGPFSRVVTEAARIAYQGPLPYPLLSEDDEHPRDVLVKCIATTASGVEFQGYLTPLMKGCDLTWLSPAIFTPGGVETLCLGELDAAQQARVLPRWRAKVEANLGRPLRALFPITLTVPDGLLPPGVPAQWSLPSLMYLSGWKPQVMPLT
jgi:hypothetical protein